MAKPDVYKTELEKLRELFKGCDPTMASLAEGLVKQAAYLYAANVGLEEKMLEAGGMVRFHPQRPELQKNTEAAKQYLKNANAYANIISKLSGILGKRIDEDDEDLDEYTDE